MSPPSLPDPVKDIGEVRDEWDLVDPEVESSSGWAKALFSKRTHPPPHPDAIATRRSVFDDPCLAPFYSPKKDYENIHRFNPLARWTYGEEKALLRKLDWKIMVVAALFFSTSSLDIGNLNHANSTSFLSDLHLTTDDFNLGNTLFLLANLCAQLPFQAVSKRVGPDRWIPTQICLSSIVSFSQFWLTGRASFLTCRALLGLLQGGFVSGLVLYLSYFYSKTELPVRLCGVTIFAIICGISSSFLAFGILHLDGAAGKAGWLFLIEGSITFLIGFASFFNMPPSPTQTKTWFRPKGWFTEREEVIIVNKILRDDPTKSDMHNREGLTLNKIWVAICDFDLWPLYIILSYGIPAGPPATYFTLLLRHAGFASFSTNLLTIPYQVMRLVNIFVITLVSQLVNEQAFVAMMGDVWVMPFLVAIYVLPSSPHPWLFFVLLTGLLSHPVSRPIQMGWISKNSGGVAHRAVTVCLHTMFSQACSIVISQIYVASDAPRYERGNRILIIVCAINLVVLFPGTKLYYIWRNRQRARVWDRMTTEEKAGYLNGTKDVGNGRLDFRFAH